MGKAGIKKSVFVMCMLDSIHSARWLSQFRGSNIRFTLFPTSPHRRLHPRILALLAESEQFQLVRHGALLGWAVSLVDKVAGGRFRALFARHFIDKHNPDLVHAMELQGAGYCAYLALRRSSGTRPKLIVTNWGSDIYWFRRFPKHLDRIQRLLKAADYYSAECQRDVELARELGFNGEVLPVIPNAGGIADFVLESRISPPGNRSVILLKGYDGWVGRAIIALNALEGLRDEVKEMKIVIYSANKRTQSAAKKISRRSNLDITTFGIGELDHNEMLQWFSRAKIYIGISESDGISTSLLEAMAMGAIPVQTATSCCDEWFEESGVAVREIGYEEIQAAIRSAMKLASDANNARINRDIIRQRAKESHVAKAARTFYESE